MKKVIFVRHAKTQGNLEKRYIGRTDEPLCERGREELAEDIGAGKYAFVFDAAARSSEIWTSPMLRCRQTAGILFPERVHSVSYGLRECDFGKFEGKNWKELNGDSDYQAWIDSGGSIAFPDGEAPDDFRRRSIMAFDEIICSSLADCVIFVVHGGTIMSVMAEYAKPRKDYFDWQIENGGAVVCEFDGRSLELVGSTESMNE